MTKLPYPDGILKKGDPYTLESVWIVYFVSQLLGRTFNYTGFHQQRSLLEHVSLLIMHLVLHLERQIVISRVEKVRAKQSY